MAKRKTRGSRRRPKNAPTPGWLWMIFGLAIGLSVAWAVYVSDRRPERVASQNRSEPASIKSDATEQQAASAAQPLPKERRRFDFYEMLPNYEVVIPEQERDVQPDAKPAPVEQPGNYVLQAGSFGEYPDADRMRARLALLGIESAIQRVSIDEKTYHRVRIGPYNDLDKLNLARERLRDARIEVLRIRLGD